MKEKFPTYQHDCDRCVFIKPYKLFNTLYDVYVCPQVSGMPTLIFRFSDNGPDYISGRNYLDKLFSDENLYQAVKGEPS